MSALIPENLLKLSKPAVKFTFYGCEDCVLAPALPPPFPPPPLSPAHCTTFPWKIPTDSPDKKLNIFQIFSLQNSTQLHSEYSGIHISLMV